ncbi:MAG TPA: hypothetical protein VF071_03900 [Candidatus Limnocylindria bacterium]
MTMLQLKPLSKEAIPSALAKADRYRLLNEAAAAESICEDILAVEPDNQQALVLQLLAVTDQFGDGRPGLVGRAQAIARRLTGEYERAYYAGIVSERQGRALLVRGGPGPGALAVDWFQDALHAFERAMAVRPPGNDDAVLRWNACARALNRLPQPLAGEAERPAVISE